jgi:twinkle protein
MNKFIKWTDIRFKKLKGIEKTTCPNCSHTRKNKKDTCLYVNHNSGVAKCFNCDSLSFKDDKEEDYSEKKYTEIQNKPVFNVSNEEKMFLYVSSRKISKTTLERLYVTFENYYQPATGKKMDNIVFNYYEGSKLVSKKYRSGGKHFTQVSGAKPIFYNINSIIGQKEVYIVEGEFDVLALYEHGIKNVISVPNGANDNDEYWKNSEKYLKDIEKFVIAVDNDEKGNILKDKIAQRLGRFRCEFIEWKNKDANGDLIDGCIEDSLRSRKKFPVNGTFTSLDLKDGIFDLYNNGLPDTLYPKNECFGDLHKIYTVMRGQVNVGTGIPSHGKSNFTDWYVLNLINDYNLKGSWFSPEHSPMKLYKTNMIEKVIGRNFWNDKDGYNRISKEEINEYIEWSKEKIYLTSCNNDEFPTWDWLLDKFKEQMYSFGIDIFVIDAFNKVLLPKGNKLDAINLVLTKLTSFAQSNNVIIFLITHPTKMVKNEEGVYNCPTLYDVSGSADFRNQTHNGYTIYRYWDNPETGQEAETKFINMKSKYNFQGEIGAETSFKYCTLNGRYYANGIEPTESLISNKKQELPKPQTLDEIPF